MLSLFVQLSQTSYVPTHTNLTNQLSHIKRIIYEYQNLKHNADNELPSYSTDNSNWALNNIPI